MLETGISLPFMQDMKDANQVVTGMEKKMSPCSILD